VFLLQGFLLWVISTPLLAAQLEAYPDEIIWLDIAGFVFWIVGFTFEGMGDWQLARFKSNPENRGKVMDRGLWRFTRHPNYFGDAMVWWGYFLFALASGQAWTIFSPLIMTFLLVRVSGAVMLERALAQRKPGYQEYMRRTSPFIPLPPRRDDR
jgi:steroid 5-alpha reductase family enzyme